MGDEIANPFWWTNLYTLLYLRDFGVDPSHVRVQATIARVRDQDRWVTSRALRVLHWYASP